jgi:hypothetical protein
MVREVDAGDNLVPATGQLIHTSAKPLGSTGVF